MAVKNEVAEEMLPGGKGTARASVPQRGLRSKLLPGPECVSRDNVLLDAVWRA